MKARTTRRVAAIVPRGLSGLCVADTDEPGHFAQLGLPAECTIVALALVMAGRKPRFSTDQVGIRERAFMA